MHPRLLWLSFLLLTVSAGYAEPFFDQAAVSIVRHPDAAAAKRVKRTWGTREADGSIVLGIEGAAGATCRFDLPIDKWLQADAVIRFSVASENVTTPEATAGFALVAVRGDETRRLPVFVPTGNRHAEVGQAEVTLAGEPLHLQGFQVELVLLAAGTGTLIVRELGVEVGRNWLPREALEKVLSVAPPVHARLSDAAGRPLAIQVGEERLTGPFFSPGPYFDDPATALALQHQANLRLSRVTFNLGGPGQADRRYPRLMPHPDYFDRAALDRQIGLVAAGDCYLIVELLLWDPPDWVSDTPLSDFDPRWLRYAEAAIDQVLAHLRQIPTADRIIGVAISLSPQVNGRPWPKRLDGPEVLPHFHAWLSQRYPRLEALREAWKMPELTVDRTQLLPPEQWPSGRVYSLVHPAESRQGMDSWAFYWESWNETLLRLAKHVKDRSYGQYLTIIPGGPATFMNHRTGGQAAWPPDALRALLDSPQVDILEIPASTGDIRVGSGIAGHELLLADAAARRRKLVVVRDTLRTHLAGTRDAFSTTSLDETIQVQRRLVGSALLQQAPVLLEQTAEAAYRDPYLLGEIRRWATIAERADREPTENVAQIAFVIDPEAYRWLATRPPTDPAAMPMQELLMDFARTPWARLGAPYDVVSIDDLQPDRYRLIVFFHVLRIDHERRRLLASCQRDGRVVGWVWAGGLVSDDALSPPQMSEAVGIDLRWQPQATRFFLTPHSGLRDLGVRRVAGLFGWGRPYLAPTWGANAAFGPTFTVHDEAAKPLASYADLAAGAMALRAYPDWHAFYSASPYLNPEILRGLAEIAGVHLYTESNDIVFVTSSFILIHTYYDGIRRLRLPATEPLFEVFRSQELDLAEEHRIHLQANKTYLFYRGTRDAWLNAPTN